MASCCFFNLMKDIKIQIQETRRIVSRIHYSSPLPKYSNFRILKLRKYLTAARKGELCIQMGVSVLVSFAFSKKAAFC